MMAGPKRRGPGRPSGTGRTTRQQQQQEGEENQDILSLPDDQDLNIDPNLTSDKDNGMPPPPLPLTARRGVPRMTDRERSIATSLNSARSEGDLDSSQDVQLGPSSKFVVVAAQSGIANNMSTNFQTSPSPKLDMLQRVLSQGLPWNQRLARLSDMVHPASLLLNHRQPRKECVPPRLLVLYLASSPLLRISSPT